MGYFFLKGLSSEMEGDIKVVGFNRKVSLNPIALEAKKSYIVKGSVHNLYLKVSALYQVFNFKEQGIFQIVVFQTL